jgi:hypothetical protein
VTIIFVIIIADFNIADFNIPTVNRKVFREASSYTERPYVFDSSTLLGMTTERVQVNFCWKFVGVFFRS